MNTIFSYIIHHTSHITYHISSIIYHALLFLYKERISFFSVHFTHLTPTLTLTLTLTHAAATCSENAYWGEEYETVRCNVLEQISRLRQCFLKCVQPKDFFSFRNEVTSRKRARDGIKKGDVYETMEGESISQQSHSNITARKAEQKTHDTTHASFFFFSFRLYRVFFCAFLFVVQCCMGCWMVDACLMWTANGFQRYPKRLKKTHPPLPPPPPLPPLLLLLLLEVEVEVEVD